MKLGIFLLALALWQVSGKVEESSDEKCIKQLNLDKNILYKYHGIPTYPVEDPVAMRIVNCSARLDGLLKDDNTIDYALVLSVMGSPSKANPRRQIVQKYIDFCTTNVEFTSDPVLNFAKITNCIVTGMLNEDVAKSTEKLSKGMKERLRCIQKLNWGKAALLDYEKAYEWPTNDASFVNYIECVARKSGVIRGSDSLDYEKIKAIVLRIARVRHHGNNKVKSLFDSVADNAINDCKNIQRQLNVGLYVINTVNCVLSHDYDEVKKQFFRFAEDKHVQEVNKCVKNSGIATRTLEAYNNDAELPTEDSTFLKFVNCLSDKRDFYDGAYWIRYGFVKDSLNKIASLTLTMGDLEAEEFVENLVDGVSSQCGDVIDRDSSNMPLYLVNTLNCFTRSMKDSIERIPN